MTACVNRKHTKKVAAVVTASLVGALSLGVAPVAAMAVDSVDLLIADEDFTTSEATFTATNGVSADNLEIPENQRVAFPAGTGQYLLPTTITPKDSNTRTLKLTGSEPNAALQYYKGDTATPGSNMVASIGWGQSGTTPDEYDWTQGVYTVRIYIQDDSAYHGKYYDFTFRIVGTNLDEAVVTNTETGGTDFTWDNDAQPVSVTLDGATLSSTSYKVFYFKAGETLDSSHVQAQVKDAGEYVAAIYDITETNYAKPVKQVAFKVNQLDLSTAEVTISDVEFTTSGPNGTAVKPTTVKANGVELMSDYVTVSVNGTAWGAKGEYTATVNVLPNDGTANGIKANRDLKGTATGVKFYIVDDVVADTAFTYDATQFSAYTSASPLKIDLSTGAKFDADKIEVAGVDMNDVDVWYTTLDGAEATEADLQNSGLYVVHARVNAEATLWAQGSDTESFVVRVIAGTVDSTDVSFRYKGDVVSKIEKEYDGEDALDYIDTIVRDGKETLTAGEDYDIVVTKDGKEVDSIVDAGVYKVEVVSDSYDMPADSSIIVTVKAVALTDVYVDSPLFKEFTNASGVSYKLIPYTGEDIDPQFTFYYKNADGDRVDLPEGVIEIDGINYKGADDNAFAAADGLKDEGWYRIDLKLAKGVVNYTFTAAPAKEDVQVIATGVFADVSNDAWYASSVFAAKEQGYINGYAGTQLFGPENSIKRGDVAVVLFNMGGGSREVSEDAKNDWKLYSTKFSDVDADMYYAEAIGWAAKLGIVNGDAGADTFRPEDTVTAEEFAAMLANYAKAKGDDVDAAEADLSAYGDADQISEWAEQSVEWAVANDVMGGYELLRPQEQVSRARVAAMAVNYQPKKLSEDQFLQ